MSKNNIKRDKFSPITIAMLVVLLLSFAGTYVYGQFSKGGKK